MMEQHQILEHTIQHMRLGFPGPFILQVSQIVEVNKGGTYQLRMSLNDRKVQIGGIYKERKQLDNFWIVRIQATFKSLKEPIIIHSLEVLDFRYTELITTEPLKTLEQMLLFEFQGGLRPKKKIKKNENILERVLNISQSHKNPNLQRINSSEVSINRIEPVNSQPQLEQQNILIDTNIIQQDSKMEIQEKFGEKTAREIKENQSTNCNEQNDLNKQTNNQKQINQRLLQTQQINSQIHKIIEEDFLIQKEDQRIRKLINKQVVQNQQNNKQLTQSFQKQNNDPKDFPNVNQNIKKNNRNCPTQPLYPNFFIRDIFPKQTNWTLACRVIYLENISEYQSGKYRMSFILMDKNGDTINCVLFTNNKQKAQNFIKLNKYYLILETQIQQLQDKVLQLKFSDEAKFYEIKDQYFHLDQTKLTKIQQLQNNNFSSQINVAGIVISTTKIPSKYMIEGTLVDPISNFAINFTFKQNSNTIKIQIGMLVIFHCMEVKKFEGDLLKLQSCYKSFCCKQIIPQQFIKNYPQKFLINLQKTKHSKPQFLRNISHAKYITRTFSQLKLDIQKSKKSFFRTQLDCVLLEIVFLKIYDACALHKKKLKTNNRYCSICKAKDAFVSKQFRLKGRFNDSTQSFEMMILSRNAGIIIDMSCEQFISLNCNKQQAYLKSLKGTKYHLKIKTDLNSFYQDQTLVQCITKIKTMNQQTLVKREMI